MRPAWRLATSSLSGRRSRTALLIMAVVLSAALISVVSCALASIHAGMRMRIEATVGASDLRLTKVGKDLFPAGTFDAVRGWPETSLAVGRLRDSLRLQNDASGKWAGVLTNGVMLPGETQIRPVELLEGRLPAAAREIAIDSHGADLLGAKVGSTLRIRPPDDQLGKLAERLGLKPKPQQTTPAPPPTSPSTPDAHETLTVVGITKQPALGMGITIRPEAILPLDELRRLTHRGDVLTDVDIILKDSNAAEQVAKSRANAFGQGMILSTSAKVSSGLNQNIQQGQLGMTIASMLAYFAAAFIIMTGLTTGVTERQRELSMVRCIGGTRRQLAESQLAIGLIIGAIGALFGVPLGMLGAKLLVVLFPDQLPAGFAMNPVGLSVAVLGSVFAGLLGAAWPAWRSARITPLEGLSIRSRPARLGGILLCLVIALSLLCLQLSIIFLQNDPDRVFWGELIVGVPSTFIGYFLLSVPAFALITILLAPVLDRLLGLPRGLMKRTVLATPYRFGFTSGAMMLGLALFIAIWTNGRSVLEDWLQGLKFPDAFAAGVAITDTTRSRIQALPVVTDTVAIQVLPMRTDAFGVKALNHIDTTFIAFEPEPFFKMTTLMWVQGTPEDAIPKLKRGGAVLVAREFNTSRGIGVGDKLTLRYQDTPYDFEVVGVVSSPGLDIVNSWFEIGENYADQAVNAVFGSRDDLQKLFGVSSYRLLQIGLAREVNGKKITDAEAIQAIRDAAGSGIIDAGSGRQILDEVKVFLSGSLYVFSLVAVGAMLVACFGVSNLIIAGIQARQFEFGVLRAIGGSRGLLVRLVMGEAALIAITACILGAMMGTHGAKAGQRVNEVLIGMKLAGWPPLLPTLAGAFTLAVITLLAALPAALALGRREPRELLAAVRG